MLLDIKARFACDRCGCQFWIDLAPADCMPEDSSLFEYAENEIRRCALAAYSDELGGSVGGSVQGDKQLCQTCTTIADKPKKKRKAK